jgi:hypothetical protein
MAATATGRGGRQDHGGAFVTGAVCGGVAGAVWGLLNATETGVEARDALGRAAYGALDRLVVAAADAEVALREWLARDLLRDPEPVPRGFAWPAAADGDGSDGNADADADMVVLGGEAFVGERTTDEARPTGIGAVLDGLRPAFARRGGDAGLDRPAAQPAHTGDERGTA